MVYIWYQMKGFKSARVLFAWEAVQSTLGGAVPAGGNFTTYLDDLKDVVKKFLDQGIYVVLGMYQQRQGDTGVAYKTARFSDGGFTVGDFKDFWKKMATAINAFTGNDRRVAFDLINEPHEPDVTVNQWFDLAQNAIDGIRASGATNTIFVPGGKDYGAASKFVTNGSAAKWLLLNDPLKNLGVTVHCYIYDTGYANLVDGPRRACADTVDWARRNGVKVHIGEIAIDAGDNGAPPFRSDLATATAQWANWRAFCIENSDVLISWNWWANSAGGWWNKTDSERNRGWGLTLDDGTNQTVYMDLIQKTLRSPRLTIGDNAGDTGSEPNPTTVVSWESSEIWVRQSDDGGIVNEPVSGGASCVVHVAVTNRGDADYPAGGNDVVKVVWAKAGAGLNWPAPWDGSVVLGGVFQGGTVDAPRSVGSVLVGQRKILKFPWTAPDPALYGGDGHFCLLAVVEKPEPPAHPVRPPEPFGDFTPGVDIHNSVLNLSNVGWKNLHINPALHFHVGRLVLANPGDDPRQVRVRFEAMDHRAKPVPIVSGELIVKQTRVLGARYESAVGEVPDADAWKPFTISEAGFELDLESGGSRWYDIEFHSQDERGAALRATQYYLDEYGEEATAGGQTFVIGKVDGYSVPPDSSSRNPALLKYTKGLGARREPSPYRS